MTPAPTPSDCSIPAPTKPVTSVHYPHDGRFVHGAYYPSWKVYRKQPPSSMDLARLTHVYYAFVRVREDGTVYHLDEKADTQLPVDGTHGCLHALTHLRDTQHPHLKLLLSVGGSSGSQPFPSIAASPTARAALAQNLRAFVDRFGFDGVDLDWEHPSTPATGATYRPLLAALRAALPPPRYLLAAALPTGAWCLRHVPLAACAPLLDHLHLMCYDYAGGWTPHAGHHAQLFAPRAPADAYAARSGDAAVRYVVGERGVPAAKVVLGVPVYGRLFRGAAAVGDGFARGSGEAVALGECPRSGARGEEVVDEELVAVTCVVVGGEEGGLVSYDNAWTVGRKGAYVRERGLGGLFYWTGVGDREGEESLVRSGFEALYGSGG